MLGRLARILTSLRLTVALLALGLVLVTWGTLSQVHLGLYRAQNEFFRSFFIYWTPAGSSLRLPIFPGGYLVGGLLVINLLAAHLRYYQPGKRKYGIIMIHLGIVLLLLGQLLTDLLSSDAGKKTKIFSAKREQHDRRTGRSFESGIAQESSSQHEGDNDTQHQGRWQRIEEVTAP